jgi:hypothetical protein
LFSVVVNGRKSIEMKFLANYWNVMVSIDRFSLPVFKNTGVETFEGNCSSRR